MKPTRFVRKPTVAIGYQVVEKHLDVIARWCGGEVVPADPEKKIQLHINVPRTGPSAKALSEARVGFWILGTFQYARKTFKVYNEIRLNREYNPTQEDDDLTLMKLAIPESEFVIPEEPPCCQHCKNTAATPAVPKQTTAVPTPALFSAR